MACPLRKYVAVLSVVAALFAAVFAFFARPDTPDVDYVVPNDASGATEAAGSETPEEADTLRRHNATRQNERRENF